MIPIEKEPQELIEELRVYEHCYFCDLPTDTWHLKTNQPVCKKCAKEHKVIELKKAWER